MSSLYRSFWANFNYVNPKDTSEEKETIQFQRSSHNASVNNEIV